MSPPQEDPLDVPEIPTLRDLRAKLAPGGLPVQRTPKVHVRLTMFRVVEETLRLFAEYRRRTEGGGRWRLVERPHPTTSGRLILEFAIEVEP